jgi:uncharacterized protein
MQSAKRASLLVLLTVCFASLGSLSSRATDLSEAIKSRDVAQVRSLLAAGADVNEKVRGATDPIYSGDYPLNIAAVFGPAEMVSLLLEAGAKLEQPGRDGSYPLHNAVRSGGREIVALLIQRGAVVDAMDRLGSYGSPLFIFAATAGSDIEIARMLLAAGADPNLENDDGDQPLHYAAISGNVELGKLLIAAHVDVNHVDKSGWTPLHTAVDSSKHEFVRLLIAAGADVNLTNQGGLTPLSLVRKDDEATRQLLIEAGAK